MNEEQAILEEAMDYLPKALQRLRATQTRMWSTGLLEHPNYRELFTRLSMALASAEAAYMEARRRLPRGSKQ